MVWSIVLFCAFVLGACLGSYANVVALRWYGDHSSPNAPASHCTACGVRLTWWQLVPVVSWFILRARCSRCGVPIPARYIVVELAAGAWCATVVALFTPAAALWLAIIGMLWLVAALVDAEHYLLPDRLIWPAAVLAIGVPVANEYLWPHIVLHVAPLLPTVAVPLGSTPLPSASHALAGALLYAGSFWLIRTGYRRLRGREGLGLGDVKLMLSGGAVCGVPLFGPVLLAGSVIALVYAMLLPALNGRAILTDARIPFGPFLIIGFATGTVLFGLRLGLG